MVDRETRMDDDLKRLEQEVSIQRKTIDLLKLENEALRLALERMSEGRHE